MENGIWSEWSPWSTCFGNCRLSVRSRWRYCHHHSKQLMGYLRCVGQPIEMRNCMKPPYSSPSLYPGGRKTHFSKPDGDKLHKQMDVELSEESGKGRPSKSDENNPDFHVHYIQCRPGKDCQKLRAQCLKAGQGRAKVNVSRNEDKIETAPGKTGLEGSMTDSKEGAQLKKTIVETPKLFHPSTNVERNKPFIEDDSYDNNWTDGGITEDAADTFSRIKADVNEIDESASKSEPKKEECDVNIGNLNNQSMTINIRQPKDEKIIDINTGLFGLNDQTTVPPNSSGKGSKLLTLLMRSTKISNIHVYSNKAKEAVPLRLDQTCILRGS